MRILAIGNGFDIDHGLRSQYTDFLKFARWINAGHSRTNNSFSIKDEDIDIFENISQNYPTIISELISRLENNIWIKYFTSIVLHNDNWIDFECEIASVIKVFEKIRNDYISRTCFYSDVIDSNNDVKRFYKMVLNVDKDSIEGKEFDSLRDAMLSDLKKLTRALEIYLAYWIDEPKVLKMNPSIYSIHPNKIISFNYSHTFDKIYSKNDYGIEFCYIHGEAIASPNGEHNMVLGIDDIDEDKNEDGYFIGFKKYYQRLAYKTDTCYKDWIEEIKKKDNESHELFIFGHSLDITDIEVFKPLLELENVKTKIYYHDLNSRADKIKNVIRLIGKDLTIEKMHSGDIKFEVQLKPRNIENSELEIRSDYHQLYRLDTMSFTDVNKLLSKIQEKIKDKDAEYFRNCGNLITIIDALASNNLMSMVDENKIDDIIYIMVTDVGNEFWYQESEWVDFHPDGEPFLRTETKMLLDKVNSCISGSINLSDLRTDVEKYINEKNYDPEMMKREQFVEIFDKAFEYFLQKDKIDDEGMRYVSHLMIENSPVAVGAIRMMKRKIDTDLNYGTPSRKVYYSALKAELDEILFENSLEDDYLSNHNTKSEG